MKCRFCQNELTQEVIDMINAPPSNSFLTQKQLTEPEVFYPLKLYVCEKCWLVQIDEYKKSNKIFDQNYVYFSSYSKSWLAHAKKYVEMIIPRLGLESKSNVIEIASNDGYLLRYFQEKNIPCLGIEPAENTARVAVEKGIPVISEFFGESLAKQLAEQGKTADLLLGNNVLPHVPNINDFVKGLKITLKKTGVLTLEFPHLMRLMGLNQFDTIYHEHYSYFSLMAVQKIFNAHGLEIFDVEELTTHGGSLRIYAKHLNDSTKEVSNSVAELLQQEEEAGMNQIEYYKSFQHKADQAKYALLSFLIEQKQQGKKIVAYGAAAKGNTLFNYCGIKKDLIPFVVDISPHKQGKYLPGVHVPVVKEKEIQKVKPDFVLILAWNISEEICAQLRYIRDWGGKFVLPIPEMRVLA